LRGVDREICNVDCAFRGVDREFCNRHCKFRDRYCKTRNRLRETRDRFREMARVAGEFRNVLCMRGDLFREFREP
jgi:hypothetical protein